METHEPARPREAVMQYCTQPGCAVLVPKGRCRTHAVQQEHTRRNRDVRTWYYTARWARLRQQVLVQSAYTCAVCRRVLLDLEVDHIVKHGGDPALFWNTQNLQPLCRTCHQSKTARGE